MVIKRLLGYLKPHKKQLAISFILLFLATVADVLGPIIIKIFIDEHLVPRNFARLPLTKLAGGYGFLLIITVTLNYYQLLNFNKIALRVIQQLRIDVFNKVQHLNVEFFDKTPTGQVVSRITNDTEAIKELFVNVLATYVQNIVLMVGVFIAMFSLNVQLAVFAVGALPVIFGLMYLYKKLSTEVYHYIRQRLSQINSKLNESLQGMNIIQAMGQETRLSQEYGKINNEYYLGSLKSIKLNGLLLRPAVDLLYIISLIIVLSYFGSKSFTLPVQLGVLYAFLNYLKRFFEPVNMMIMRLSQLQQALVAAERVFELLDDARQVATAGERAGLSINKGRVEFKNVSFSYDGQNQVLKDISFIANPGQTIALVGHTGSGKSTITNLLMRFYPIEEGEIFIDGIPLEEYANEELRRNIGLVLQDPFLFVGDIKQNIRLHNQEISDAEIKEAAKFVQAHHFIEKLPEKYNEKIGERGATLSSGQRQLLSFARAMAIHPKILILDEATANIDTETEELIQTALEKMRQGRTTIAIAHRLSTIQDADLILVLHKGKIVERGNHQELLNMKGLYHKMYLLQQGAIS